MAVSIIDVSSNQGVINWAKVKNSGVTDVIIRLTMGYGKIDTLAIDYAKKANAAGIAVSYYHFAYPDTKQGGTITKDAEQEALFFVSTYINNNLPSPKWLALDLEFWDSAGTDSPLNKIEYLTWVKTFIGKVFSEFGLNIVIYGNKSYLDSHLPVNHGLGNLDLWVANYNIVSTPPLPIGWSKYLIWQYSQTGNVPGINGNCDLNKNYQSIQIEKLIMNKRRSRA